jgi:predicted enzyme related to lactoylglutathione lyase
MTSASVEHRGRVVGIGGIFLKSSDQARLRSWYQDQLGLRHDSECVQFKWHSPERPEVEHVTVWSVFPAESPYFHPSNATFMINYIVDDLDAILAKLSENGVQIDPKREDYDYGRFAWIFDPDGNKIELWEPPSSKSGE